MRFIATILAAVGAVVICASSAAPAPIFEDDFQTGIDPSRWVLHNPGGGTWIPAVENCNGYITSPPQAYVLSDDRQDNIVTVRDDFGDFVMTWNMRFQSDGWHAARRDAYFRCDTRFEPLGYWLHIAINDPPQAHPTCIYIACMQPNGQFALISDIVDYPWQLNRWYSFVLRVVGNTFKVKTWPLGDPQPAGWTLEAQDPASTYSQGRVGFGDYWYGITDADNVVVSPIAAPACELPLRNPQVSLNGSELQSYFNGLGESVNVYADQLAAQVCSTSVSGNSTATLMIELSGNANQNSFGIYNALEGWFHNVPPPQTTYEIFPANAGAGWVALVNFLSSGNLVVNLFDNTGTLVRHEDHGPAFLTKIGFYLARPGGGLLLSQDGLNGGGVPQALMYAGTGRNWGEVWLCWEDTHPADCSDRDFNDAVLVLQSLQPVRTLPSTWSALKARYR